MHPRLPVVMMFAVALATPGMSYAKDKDKNKSKGQKEQKAGDRDEDGDDDGDHDGNHDGKMTICHVPPGNRSARHTITVGDSAWHAHQAHGDYRGACRAGGGNNQDERFNNLDRNRNGVVSADEWPGDKGTFDRLDRDKNGVLSREEFRRY